MSSRETLNTVAGLGLLVPLARNWWLLLLRGLASIAFGVLAFAWSQITLLALVLLFGAFAFADGVLGLAAAFRGEQDRAPRWWLAALGVAGVLAGLVAFASPGVTALTFALLLGAWSVVSGAFQIGGAIRLRKEIEGEWLLIAAGLVNVLFGAIVLAIPGLGLIALVYVVGFYAVASGIALAAFAWRIRRRAD
jgi:uncharacterized membrane protein HdeD (DUF308 family)